MYKIVIVGESPNNPSGFGQQVRMLAEGFQKRGHEVNCISVNHPLNNLQHEIAEWRVPDIMDVDVVDRTLHQLQPDIVINFWHTAGVQRAAASQWSPANAQSYYWLPWEGSSIPNDLKECFAKVETNRIVHLSEYANDLWRNYTDTTEVIPHGVDPEIFNREPIDRAAVRKRWSEKFSGVIYEDDIVILSVDRNIWHKRWDATIDLVRRVQEKTTKRVKLLAHCRKKEDAPAPINGYNIPELEVVYGLKPGTIVFTDFDWINPLTREELCELYKGCDIRVSCSQGEGFGIPTVEAAFSGCLQVVNDTTTMPELFPEDSPCRVTPAMTEAPRHVLYHVPDVKEMANRVCHFLFTLTDEQRDGIRDVNEEHARGRYSSSLIIDKWCDLFGRNRILSYKDRWYKHWRGYNHQLWIDYQSHHLITMLKELVDDKSQPLVFEVGSQDGRFVNDCQVRGINIKGLEPDLEAHARSHEQARQLILQQPVDKSWPKADIIVVNDTFTYWDWEDVVMAATKIQNHEWLVIRNKTVYKRETQYNEPGDIETLLKDLGGVRRHDLEYIAKEKLVSKDMSHEIWNFGENAETTLPEGFQ